jgi:hypothetical protein
VFWDKIANKEWWKLQFKFRDSFFLLYAVWIAYGAWLLSVAILEVFYNVDYHAGYIIAFIWFLFYCLIVIHSRNHNKMMEGFLRISWEHTDRATKGWDEALKYAQRLEKELEIERKSHEK